MPGSIRVARSPRQVGLFHIPLVRVDPRRRQSTKPACRAAVSRKLSQPASSSQIASSSRIHLEPSVNAFSSTRPSYRKSVRLCARRSSSANEGWYVLARDLNSFVAVPLSSADACCFRNPAARHAVSLQLMQSMLSSSSPSLSSAGNASEESNQVRSSRRRRKTKEDSESEDYAVGCTPKTMAGG